MPVNISVLIIFTILQSTELLMRPRWATRGALMGQTEHVRAHYLVSGFKGNIPGSQPSQADDSCVLALLEESRHR